MFRMLKIPTLKAYITLKRYAANPIPQSTPFFPMILKEYHTNQMITDKMVCNIQTYSHDYTLTYLLQINKEH